jgi:hypothetical protein
MPAGSKTTPSGSVAAVRPDSRSSWLIRNEKFVRAICMIAVYVSGVMFLIAVLAVGGMGAVSDILLAVFVVSLSTLVVLYKRKRRET